MYRDVRGLHWTLGYEEKPWGLVGGLEAVLTSSVCSTAPRQPGHEPGPLQSDHFREALCGGHAVAVERRWHPGLL